jgi:IclR family acetate operon transcriptional repressor
VPVFGPDRGPRGRRRDDLISSPRRRRRFAKVRDVQNGAVSPQSQTSAGSQALVRNESLRRGLLVLRALAAAGAPITAAELARQTGIPGPTVARLLVTLEDETMAVRDAGGGWRPGTGIAELAGAEGGIAAVVAAAADVLRDLANDTGETALLSRVRLPDVSEVLVQEHADRLLGATDWVGRTFDARRSVAGWVVAAELGDAIVEGMGSREEGTSWVADVEATRARGYALDVGGLEDGLTSVAVILQAGVPGLAVGMAGPSTRLTPKRAERMIPRLRQAAHDLALLTE